MLREKEGEIHKLDQDQAAAIAQNRMEDAAQIKKERDSRLVVLNRLKQAMATAVIRNQQQQFQHARSNSQGQPQSTNLAAPTNTQAPSQSPQMPATTSSVNSEDIPRGPDSQALIQLMQSRTAPNQSGAPSLNMTPEMFSQMQKLVEKRGIRPQQPSFPQVQQNQSPSMAVPAPAPQQPTPREMSSWEGSLTWTGFHLTTYDRKEMHAQVKVASPTSDIMPATWPPNLMLTPSREPAVSVQDMQIWAKRTNALLCTLQAHARSVDQETNERNFRALIELLAQKRMYAQAAWALPSGVNKTNLLIFPFNGNNLVCAAFPTTGIPEMPKPLMASFSPDVAAQLQRLTPDQRGALLTNLMRHGQQQQQQFQPQQQCQQQLNYNLGAPNFGDSGQFQQVQQNQPPSMAVPAPAPQQSTPGEMSSWEGSLTWTGYHATTYDRKEIHAQVKVASPTGDIMPATWPPNLTLTPSREPAVSLQDIQIWAKRTNALLCTLTAHARSIDEGTNEPNIRCLIELLTQKRIVSCFR
jgi:mediator of RNA polymerase II transcription subunit 25